MNWSGMKGGKPLMDLNVVAGDLLEQDADTIIVNLFADVERPVGATGVVDFALQGAISELIAENDFSGKEGEVAVLYPRGLIKAKRVILVGLGLQNQLKLDGVRRAAAAAIRRARELNSKRVATIVHGGGLGNLPIAAAAQALVEGSLLALYKYDLRSKNNVPTNDIISLSIVEYEHSIISEITSGVRFGQAIVQGVYLARDLANMPPNMATPTKIAQTAAKIAEEYGMTIKIGDRQWASEQDMGAFLAVAQGAGEPPKFIVLEHNGECLDLETVVLVGKGITFDTGGISLKPVEKMGDMKVDMAGAAAVLGTMLVVGLLNLPLRIIGIAPCTENMPDAHAYRPADVITASNGKTIEIVSTDAEGRMVLADALVYAKQYRPKAVIDLATLTSSCMIALGEGVAAGLFCNDDNLKDRLVSSSNASQERVWPMPLWSDYRKKIESNIADLKNSGGRYGGVGTSAVFLQEFTDYPWAHLDIAGMALTDQDDLYIPRGATGFGVRLLVEFLRNWRMESIPV